MSAAPMSLKARALRLLSLREHSRAELLRKLTPHETAEGEANTLVDWLEEKGWVDHARVAESVVHQKANRYGDRRIRADMQAKGLSADEIDSALANQSVDETTRARAVWAKKFDGPPQTPAERAKQMRFLVSRGFAVGVVMKVIQGDDTGH